MAKISEVVGNSFEDGQLAGMELLQLYKEIGCSIDHLPKPNGDAVRAVLSEIWNAAERRYPNEAVVGFLSEVMRHKEYETSLISFWGLDQLIEYQQEWAPICELGDPREAFQFAFWTGDFSDGDGWCFDIPQSVIRCVTVGSAPGIMQELRDSSYGVYESFHYLVAHLRCSARRRGWIDA